jgi:HSP20 family protein
MVREIGQKVNMKYKTIHGQMVPHLRGELVSTADQIFNQLFNDAWPEWQKDMGIDFTKGAYPRVDVIDEDSAIFIEAEIPGLSKKDVSVDVKDNLLIISGGRMAKKDPEKGEPRYILKELKRSSFQRSFTLTDQLDASKIEAHFDNGLLTIAIPKREPSLPESRTIDIT